MRLHFTAMAVGLAAVMLSGCGGRGNGQEASGGQTVQEAPAPAVNEGKESAERKEAEVVLQVGFENSMSEPISQGLVQWQELLDEQSGGTMKIDLYPDSQLGDKTTLIDSMLMGENVCTLADGAFYADYGVPDMGILFGPFLFEDWEQCWRLIESDWYGKQSGLLEERGLKLVSSNWMFGERHIISVRPVNRVEDLKGMKIRVPSNEIQTQGFNCLGAAATGMPFGDVYQALQTKTIDGAENTLSSLYGRKFFEVAQNITLDGHVKNFTTWVCSAEWFNSLTSEQQELLVSTANEAGLYNNELQLAADQEYLQKFRDEGVNIIEPSEEALEGFKEKAKAFYELGDKLGWSEGLYDTVKKEMGAE